MFYCGDCLCLELIIVCVWLLLFCVFGLLILLCGGCLDYIMFGAMTVFVEFICVVLFDCGFDLILWLLVGF